MRKPYNRQAEGMVRIPQPPQVPQPDPPADPPQPPADAGTFPIRIVPADPPELVRQCPVCGASRRNQWERRSGGRGHPYYRCRACDHVFCVNEETGYMRLIR